MARRSAAATDMIEHAVAVEPLPPPSYLTGEEAGDWRALVGVARLAADQAPLLAALVQAMSRSRRLAAALAAMGDKSLTGTTKAASEVRPFHEKFGDVLPD